MLNRITLKVQKYDHRQNIQMPQDGSNDPPDSINPRGLHTRNIVEMARQEVFEGK